MKLVFEFARIAAFCFAGEVCHLVLPLPIPASVYGLMLLLAALIAGRAKLRSAAILAGICGFPACVFFALGALGMVCMCIFARRLDSSDPRANWLEQGVNALAQICIYIGLLLV